MRRRAFTFGTAGLAGSWALSGTAFILAADGESLAVDIALGNDPPDRALAILRELDVRDVREVKQRGLGGIETVVAGILLTRQLANLIARLLPVSQCGLVVDGRGARVLAEKNCDLPRGTVQVINPGGTSSTLAQPSTAQLESIVKDFAAAK